MAMKAVPHVLVIAGSDSSGGAGIVRDIETLSAFGVKASVAVTAVTVQTDTRVLHVDPVAPARVAEQMRAALVANTVSAIKIGMLANAATIAAVAAVLDEHRQIPVVLDSVLASTSGGALSTPQARVSLHRLFGRCALITPNLAELRQLAAAGRTESADDWLEDARQLIAMGAHAVLVKGGHGHGPESADILLRADHTVQYFTAPRLAATMRGTGCMLASAIAAGLGSGKELASAITGAKAFVQGKLKAASDADGSV